MEFEKTYEILGRSALLTEFEQAVYTIADNFLADYNGGMWQEVAIPNGFFWRLKCDKNEKFCVSTPGGTYKENVSADFAGLALTEMACSYLLEKSYYGKITLSNSEQDKIISVKRAIGDYVYSENGDKDLQREYFELMD